MLDTLRRASQRLIQPGDQSLRSSQITEPADQQSSLTAILTFAASSTNVSAATARVPSRCSWRASKRLPGARDVVPRTVPDRAWSGSRSGPGRVARAATPAAAAVATSRGAPQQRAHDEQEEQRDGEPDEVAAGQDDGGEHGQRQ